MQVRAPPSGGWNRRPTDIARDGTASGSASPSSPEGSGIEAGGVGSGVWGVTATVVVSAPLTGEVASCGGRIGVSASGGVVASASSSSVVTGASGSFATVPGAVLRGVGTVGCRVAASRSGRVGRTGAGGDAGCAGGAADASAVASQRGLVRRTRLGSAGTALPSSASACRSSGPISEIFPWVRCNKHGRCGRGRRDRSSASNLFRGFGNSGRGRLAVEQLVEGLRERIRCAWKNRSRASASACRGCDRLARHCRGGWREDQGRQVGHAAIQRARQWHPSAVQQGSCRIARVGGMASIARSSLSAASASARAINFSIAL